MVPCLGPGPRFAVRHGGTRRGRLSSTMNWISNPFTRPWAPPAPRQLQVRHVSHALGCRSGPGSNRKAASAAAFPAFDVAGDQATFETEYILFKSVWDPSSITAKLSDEAFTVPGRLRVAMIVAPPAGSPV